MQLKAITDRVHYIPGPVNVGVLRIDDHHVALIDAGFDRRYGRRIAELLEDYGYQIEYILVTHGHADHVGGAACLHGLSGCRVLASPEEAAPVSHPMMQAIALFGGAPIDELKCSTIMAEPCPAESFSAYNLLLRELEIQILPLPGHSIGQVGFLVDRVAFLADTVFPTAYFKKHKLLFTYDPLQHLETLEKIKDIQAEWFVPGHGTLASNIDILLTENIHYVKSSLDFLRDLLQTPQSLDHLLKAFLNRYRLRKKGWEHFVYRTTVTGMLSALRQAGEIEFRIIDNLLVWYATGKKP